MSSDRKSAVIYLSDGRNFGLYSSEGKVADMVMYFLSPMGMRTDITVGSYFSSFEETAVIELEKVAA